MKTFPITQIPHPVVSRATNAGDTYVEKITDSTVESKTDAGYRLTKYKNAADVFVFLDVSVRGSKEYPQRLLEGCSKVRHIRI